MTRKVAKSLHHSRPASSKLINDNVLSMGARPGSRSAGCPDNGLPRGMRQA